MTDFDRLNAALRYHIVGTLGWTSLRATQLEAIAPVLAGGNVLLLAPTAGGKAEAELFPVLSRMLDENWQGLSVLYVCPLRALLNNLEPRIHRYAQMVERRTELWHGDVADPKRRRFLRDPADILLTTPESLEAMLISTRVDHRVLFAGLRSVLVDELHAFAGDDRGWHLLAVLERLERLCGRRLQRIGLSATIGNPEELLQWLGRGLAGRVVGPAHAAGEGDVTVDFVGSLDNAATVLTQLHRGERRLVFCDSRARVETLAAVLRQAGVRTFVSHSSLSLDERRRAEEAFAAEPDCIIVATSTLELGLDVGDLDRVIQIDAPPSVSSFLQRMGRTGRRPGARRNCLMLATSIEALMIAQGIGHLWRDGFVEMIRPPPSPTHIFAQQVMALVLQEGGIADRDWRLWLDDVLAGVDRGTEREVVAHMLEQRMLAEDGGVLGLGPAGEAAFGRRNFQDLVAAFTTPLLLAVRHGNVDLGSIDPLGIESQRTSVPVILLGGRSWRVLDVDWPRRVASVEPAAEQGRSRWFGSARALHAELAQAIEQVLVTGDSGVTLSRRADAALGVLRQGMPFLDGEALPVVASGDEVRIWTFAGGRANAILAAALSSRKLSVRMIDNFSVAIAPSDGDEVIRALRTVEVDNLQIRVPDRVMNELKFRVCLPDDCARAVLTARLAAPDAVEKLLCRPRRIVRLS